MLRVVLDTNVLSELMRAEPNPTVVEWAERQAPSAMTTTAITVAEIRLGLARLPAGRRRARLQAAADDLFDAFAASVLPFNLAAANYYAEIVARRQRRGRPISAVDAQIAAVCRHQGAILATRNGRDFDQTGITVVDPWTSET